MNPNICYLLGGLSTEKLNFKNETEKIKNRAMAKKNRNNIENEIDHKLSDLYRRYFFNRDMGDMSRENYWLSRIKEYEQLNNIKNGNNIAETN
jgi:hypothetical protein